MRIYCTSERHANGGPGEFILGGRKTRCQADRRLPGTRSGDLSRPAFGTGDTFHIKLDRGKSSCACRICGRHGGGRISDLDARGPSGARELLCESGSLYLHIDYRMSAKLGSCWTNSSAGKLHERNRLVYKSGGRSTRYYPRNTIPSSSTAKRARVFRHLRGRPPARAGKAKPHEALYRREGRVCFSIRSGASLHLLRGYAGVSSDVGRHRAPAAKGQRARRLRDAEAGGAAQSRDSGLPGRAIWSATCFPAAAPPPQRQVSLAGGFWLRTLRLSRSTRFARASLRP